MHRYLKSRERFLHSGIQIYTTPMLLASALDKLERLADKHRIDTLKPRRAGPGCVVDLLDLTDQITASFELVMPNDADPKNRRISVLSPLGSSLLGLKREDICRVHLFGSCHRFQLVDIRYADSDTTRREETTS